MPPAPKEGTTTFIPHIYSHEELARLLRAAPDACQRRRALLNEDTLCTVLLLLYGAGLRLGEAIQLDVGDVDLEQALLTVQEKARMGITSFLNDTAGIAAYAA